MTKIKDAYTKMGVQWKKLTTFQIIFFALASLKYSESCSTIEFQCSKSKVCVPVRYRCDGDEDCGLDDKSDEANCTSITRACSEPEYQFRCNNGKCINRIHTCDRDNDCGDRSDERFCVELANDCEGKFRCLSGECIANQSKCDGRRNCKDGSDELYCNSTICTGFQCNFSGECLGSGLDKKCDLKYDCDDKTDEVDCPATAKIHGVTTLATVEISGTAKWTFNVLSNTDKFEILWKKPGDREIVFGTGKYKLSVSKKPIFAWATYEITMQIIDVTRDDEGIYPLQIMINSTTSMTENLYLTLVVEASKTVRLETKNNRMNFLENHVYSITCTAPLYSDPQWTFQWCNSSTLCSNPIKVNETWRENVEGQVVSTLQFKAISHGVYRCSTDKSTNYGLMNFQNTDIKRIRVVDFPGNDLISIDKPNNIIEGDTVLVSCAVSAFYTNKQPHWYIIMNNGNLSMLTNRAGRNFFGERTYEIIGKNSKWSYTSILKFYGIKIQSSLQLQCMTGTSSDDFHASIQLIVQNASKPEIVYTNLKNTSIKVLAGNIQQLDCNVIGLPKPQISWTWERRLVSEWPPEINYTIALDKTRLIIYNVSKTIEGEFKCTSKNRKGEISAFTKIIVNDNKLPEFVHTNLLNSSVSMKSSDTLDLFCNATGRPKPKVTWFWNNISRSKWPPILQDSRHAKFYGNEFLTLQFLSEDAQGRFMCEAKNENGFISAFVDIWIETEKKMPEFVYTNLPNSIVLLKSSDTLDLICNVTGHPRPTITWFWNNISRSKWPSILQDSRHARLYGNEFLTLQFLSEDAQGQFMCEAKNDHGAISAYADISIETISEYQWETLIWVTVSLGLFSGIVLSVFGAFVIRYKLKQKKLNAFLNGIYKKEFYDGQIENINPELSVSDQANLLPFQKSTWEVPRERLKLGIILGSGAFGLVLKAQAFEIVEGEQTTEVAVKTVKENADETHFKALMTELKIMAHLGKHLNIVNLIGACTKNLVKKRELLVVMEFCKYGSLQTFMLRNKKSFLDQLDPKTDRIDPSICVQSQESTVHTDSSGRPVDVSSGTFLDSYKGDYNPSDTKPITSTDLLSWAFQVSKGMEYLSSRKVLHGDLASRNVLLAENNIVKICDFGYARETFKNYDYKKDTKGVLLPIKWMAIESIYSGIFSSMSDCWSFGVFLWELFSLGNKPYPGLEVNENFCERINYGYRMDKPQYAPVSVYCIMLDCWAHEPTYRPTFAQLSDKLGGLISSWLRNRIIDLNEGYTRLNQESKICGEERDYLMEMGQAEVSVQIGEAPDSKLLAPIPDRYQGIPSPFTSFGAEPQEDIAVNKKNRQSRFFKPRPPPPPPRKIFND